MKNKGLTIFLLLIVCLTLQLNQNSVLGQYLGEYEVEFFDDFESQNFDNWSGTLATSGETLSIVNLDHVLGYSAKFTSDGSKRYEASNCYSEPESYPEINAFGVFKILKHGLVEENDRMFFIVMKSGNTDIAYAGLRMHNGKIMWNLVIRDGTRWVSKYSDFNVKNLYERFRIDLRIKIDDTEGAVKLYNDEEDYIEIKGVNTAYFGDVTKIRYGLAQTFLCDSTEILGDRLGWYVPEYEPGQTPGETGNVVLESTLVVPSREPSEHSGEILIDDIGYHPPGQISLADGTYSLEYRLHSGNSDSRYLYHWETEGDISVGNIQSSETTLIVNGEGVLRAVAEPYMPQYLSEGFESGTFDKWTGSYKTNGETLTATSEHSSKGTKSARFSSDGTNRIEKSYVYADAEFTNSDAQQSEINLGRGSFMVSESGLVENEDRFSFMIFQIKGSGVAFAGWRQYKGEMRWNLIIRDGSSFVSVVSDESPNLGQWYDVELFWQYGEGDGCANLYVDGKLVCSTFSKDTAYLIDKHALEQRVVKVGIAGSTNCGPITLYADEIQFRTRQPDTDG